MKIAMVVMVIAALLAGCEVPKATTSDGLPAGAESVQDRGNGWVTFKWNGECFLYTKRTYDRSLSQALTRVACDR